MSSRAVVLQMIQYEREGVTFLLGKGDKGKVFVKFTQNDEVEKFVRANKKEIIGILRKRFSREELTAINNFAGELAFCYPGEMSENIERYNSQKHEDDPDVVEFILRNFEEEALRVLCSENIHCLDDALEWEKAQEIEGPIDHDKAAAIFVLRDAYLVRGDIESGRAAEAAIRMMKLTANLLKAAYPSTLFTGLRREVSRQAKKPGKEAARGIELLVLDILANNPSITGGELEIKIKSLLRKEKWAIEDDGIRYSLSLEDDKVREDARYTTAKISAEEKEIKPKIIALSTIKKHYLPRLKKR